METGARTLDAKVFGTALKSAVDTGSPFAVECLMNEPKTFETVDVYDLLCIFTSELLGILQAVGPRPNEQTRARVMHWIRLYRRCVDRAFAYGDVRGWNGSRFITGPPPDHESHEHILILCTRLRQPLMLHALLKHLPMLDIDVCSVANGQTALEIAESNIDAEEPDAFLKNDAVLCLNCLEAAHAWMDGYRADVNDLLYSSEGLAPKLPFTLLTVIAAYLEAPPKPKSSKG